jgi:peptidoglycan/LPS O-acetylase OafA/YrhL
MLDHKRQNNFDAARLFLATTVVLSHLIWILPGDYGLLKVFIEHFDGRTAVDCFFVISGFLIFRSFRRSRRHFDYWSNRISRIYPALVAALVMTVVLGAFITSVSPGEYFCPATLQYLLFNLLFMSFKHSTLPGLFGNNEVYYANGALWTLKIEVMFYATVPLIAFFARKFVRFEILAGAIYVLSVLFKMVLHHLAVTRHSQVYEIWGNQLPGQLSFFLAGGLLEYYSEGFRRHASIYLVLAVLGLIISTQLGVYAFYPASLAVVVIYMCDVFPRLCNVSKYGDFSYGLYVCHFPVIQSFAALALLAGYPGLRAVTTLLSCLLCAVLSWHLVEKWWLRPKSHLSPLVVSQGSLSVIAHDTTRSPTLRSPSSATSGPASAIRLSRSELNKP